MWRAPYMQWSWIYIFGILSLTLSIYMSIKIVYIIMKPTSAQNCNTLIGDLVWFYMFFLGGVQM